MASHRFNYSILTRALLASSLASLALVACSPKQPEQSTQVVPEFWPHIQSAISKDDAIEARIADMLAGMTLEQKIAQMIQPEIRDITVEDMRQYGFGSFLNGGGSFPGNNKHATVQDWVQLAEQMYQASIDDSLDGSRIPTMWGTDAVHGHNNVIGATLFPHNIGLGAANNPELMQQIARITAKEVLATGIDWIFAPTVAVVQDDRWGRSYEGFSEKPEIVRDYAAAIVKGLQGANSESLAASDSVISTVKHFLGDGGTENGDDQGNNTADEQTLFELHAQGYVGGLAAGGQTVMASFNSWQGNKIHGSQYLLTEVLKNKMGFDGLVVGDWNGHGQIPGCSNESCPQAAIAGLDIYMVPTGAWKPLYHNLIAQAKAGSLPMARIDDAVSRILRVKLRAGLFDKPSPAKRPLAGKTELIGHSEHRAVARQAVRESLVLLKNNQQLLPLAANSKVLVAGDAADNIGKQSGGWSITWQGTDNKNADFPGATSIYQGIANHVAAHGGTATLSVTGEFTEKPDVAIVVFGEEPYAEGNGDLDNLEYQRGQKTDLALLQKLKNQGIATVAVFITGRPLWVNPELNASDAFVVAWLPGTEGQGVADVLFKQQDNHIGYDFSGKLSFSWPKSPYQSVLNPHDATYQPLFAYGYGLSYNTPASDLGMLNEQVDSAEQSLEPLAILQGVVKKPWRLTLGDFSERVEVASSVVEHKAVSLRTLDKTVQEDARLVTFHQPGLLRIQSDFPSDWRSFQEQGWGLSFAVKTNAAALNNLAVAINCATDCSNAISLAEAATAITADTWQSLHIPLACFANKQVDLSKVFNPFELVSQGAAELAIADIMLQAMPQQAYTLKCGS